MIVEELLENGARVRHCSDAGYKIRQVETGVLYEDAVDLVPCRYTYEETEEPIGPEEEAEAADYEAALERLGVSV